jgi:hypothetical protein
VSKDIDLPLSLGGFDDNAYRKILPGDAEKSFTSLTNYSSDGSQQLGEAVPVRHASFPAAVTPAFIFHALDIAEGISIASRRQRRRESETFLVSMRSGLGLVLP